MSVPAQMNRAMQLKQSPGCTNMLFNPYRLHQRLPLSSYFTPSGWKERWRRMKLVFMSQMALALCTRYIQGWSRAAFKQEAATMFTDINTHLASRSMHDIVPQIGIKSRETRQWRLAEPIDPKRDVKLVHGTPIVPGLSKLAAQMGYVQLTVCITSKQQIEVRDARGNVKKPWDDPPVEATDYWVWEHPLGPRRDSRWRLVGMVNPYEEVEPTGLQGGVDPSLFTLPPLNAVKA